MVKAQGQVKPKKIIYVYTSLTRYVSGIPARDLQESEWKALTAEQRKKAKNIYKRTEV